MKKSGLLGIACALIMLSTSAGATLMTYSYVGPEFASTTSEIPALYDGRSITGSFTTEELAPSSSINFIGSLPDFSFSDGVRSISNENTEFTVDQFTINTDASGNIEAWWIRFINSPLTNALGTYQSITGQDSTRITQTLNDCTNNPYCGGSVNTDASGTTGAWMESVTPAAVPVPAAVWLFGSGLFGLLGMARRKKA